AARVEVAAETVNINALVKVETQPMPATNSLTRLFLGDLVDIVATADGQSFVLVSRSGNYVARAALVDGKLSLENSASTPAVRIKTGWLPTGVALSTGGDRAYTYNEGGESITIIDLTTDSVLALNVATSAIPEAGSFAHDVRWGKLAFFTSIGTPNDGLRDLEI